jgi:hypothetical protein
MFECYPYFCCFYDSIFSSVPAFQLFQSKIDCQTSASTYGFMACTGTNFVTLQSKMYWYCWIDIFSVLDHCFYIPIANKAGECPKFTVSDGNCVQECQSDADCIGDAKCCFSGCVSSCLNPVFAEHITTQGPQLPPQPYGEPGG